jgi:hypothetical protein
MVKCQMMQRAQENRSTSTGSNILYRYLASLRIDGSKKQEIVCQVTTGLGYNYVSTGTSSEYR